MASKNLFIHHACHRLSHQRFGILHGQQIFCQRLTVAARAAARLFDDVLNKRLAQRRLARQNLCRQSVEINDLRPVFAQKLRKAVMLLLRAVQKRNVVKQKLLHRLRAQVLELPPRALQKDPSERSNFACHMNRHGASSSGVFSPVYQIFLSIATSGNHRIPAKSAYPFGAFFCIAARSATLPCPVIYSK